MNKYLQAQSQKRREKWEKTSHRQAYLYQDHPGMVWYKKRRMFHPGMGYFIPSSFFVPEWRPMGTAHFQVKLEPIREWRPTTGPEF